MKWFIPSVSVTSSVTSGGNTNGAEVCCQRCVCVDKPLCIYTIQQERTVSFLANVCALLRWRARGHSQSNVCFPRFKNDFSLSNTVLQIPRTIVNVVQILPMKPLREVQRPTLTCQLQKSPAVFSSSSAGLTCSLNILLSTMMSIRSQQIIFTSYQHGKVKCCIFIQVIQNVRSIFN